MAPKIISGGQTGADRAALNFAMSRGIPHGGWCPKGRLAADGPLASAYQLEETPSEGYSQRTRWNIRDADGTLVVNTGDLSGGTAFTVRTAAKLSKPCLVIQLESGITHTHVLELRQWLASSGIQVLNVAGPREEKRPGIYLLTVALLEAVFSER